LIIKGRYRKLEFKSKHLRVYGIGQPGGEIVITGVQRQIKGTTKISNDEAG